ncbi:hypothetical protein CBS101457_002997 [Exobasidium rhododendri]|nr:hypothetical protein CBS101457_002997 [Exobasidium rhododendri]
MSLIMVVSNVPYLGQIATYLPNPIRKFENWLDETLGERMRRGTEVPDVFGFLLDEEKQSMWKHTRLELAADTMLLVVAGSDTSSITMCLCLYHMIVHPEMMEQLRSELDSVFGKADCTDFDKLAKDCHYLNAIINETLRLYPPVASGLQREIPQKVGSMTFDLHGGKSIVLPADILISTPTLTLHRDPRNFSPGPDEFRPQRWISPKEETAFDRTAFNPFSYGPTSCVGKTLAYMEIRIVVACIVREFDLSLEPDFDAPFFLNGLKDIFTTKCTQHLPVRLRHRAGKA